MIFDVYKTLLNCYGFQSWWPVGKGNDKIAEIVVGAILTQNTSWKNVEKALENLAIENCLSFNKITKISEDKLNTLIKPAGFYRRKSEILKEVSKLFLEDKEISRQKLINIKGIGKETADSIMLYAFDRPYFVIDSYTKRLFFRLGITDEKVSYDGLQKIITENIPEDVDVYKEFHALIVQHCKTYCRKKPLCKGCCLRDMCRFYLNL